MASNTPNQAQPASLEKHGSSSPYQRKLVKPSAPLRNQRQEPTRGTTIGGGIRRDNERSTIRGGRPDPLAGAYFIPALSMMAERNILPENDSINLINHVRVTDEERRLFHAWTQSARQSPEASHEKIAEGSSTTSLDILNHLRTTDEERRFLRGLGGNF